MNIEALRDALRQPGARTGVGVWLMPRAYLGQEGDIAVRLNVQALDARQAYLQSLPEGTHFSGLTRPDGHRHLMDLLRTLAHSTQTQDCLLVHTLDLLLLGLEMNERECFWREALEGLPYPRIKLILAVPAETSELFTFDMQRRYTAQIAEGVLK